MMTRQHFQFIADTLKEARGVDADNPALDRIARRFGRELHRTNSRFDEEKFLKACGVK